MNTSAKFTGNISADQRSELLEFLKKYPELNSGKFANDFTYKKARELWESLATQLNALPGAHKDWKKWRKTWHDIKTRAKSEKCQVNQHRIKTGGGPPTNIQITDEEEQILEIMGSVVVEGDPTVFESQALFYEESSLTNEPLQELTLYEDEHSYPFSMDSEVMEKVGDVSPKISASKINVKTRNRGPKRLQRSEKTISATAKLAEQTDRDIAMREKYLQRKLELYEQDIGLKNRMATLYVQDILLKGKIATALESLVTESKKKQCDGLIVLLILRNI